MGARYANAYNFFLDCILGHFAILAGRLQLFTFAVFPASQGKAFLPSKEGFEPAPKRSVLRTNSKSNSPAPSGTIEKLQSVPDRSPIFNIFRHLLPVRIKKSVSMTQGLQKMAAVESKGVAFSQRIQRPGRWKRTRKFIKNTFRLPWRNNADFQSLEWKLRFVQLSAFFKPALNAVNTFNW